MRKLASILENETEDLATLITLEMGKPLEASRYEILKCADVCRYYADHAARILAPEAVPTDPNHSYVRWEPLGVILAIMILPIISSLTREVMTAVPHTQREAVLALGATRWEMIRMGVLRNARIGIVGSIILGLGRALGETMAVAMVIGSSPTISKSLLAPAATMASVIANEFAEASDDTYRSALIEIALALFLVTIVVNMCARLLVWAVTRGTPARAA